jgi:hypothetical protein
MDERLGFMIVLCYWKLLEAYVMKKLRLDGGFDGFCILKNERKNDETLIDFLILSSCAPLCYSLT